jgi:ribonucleoside-diphosphate reductase alpha chain
VGDCWEEYNVFHHKFMTWLEVNGYNPEEVMKYDSSEVHELVKKSPYYKATSNDIDWVAKVRMQGQIQQWVDHSISVTINLPNQAQQDLVGDLYIKAWQNGCKGVTVYRDGSRSGVLIANDDKKKTGDVNEDKPKPKRPKVLDAEIIRFAHNNEKWIAFIGIKDDRPYEIFTGRQDDEMFPIPKSITKGKIVKNTDENGKARYDFEYTDKYGYKNTMGGLSHQFNKEYWNYAKLISGVLRHGMPIADVVDLIGDLRLDNEFINTWTAGVERALRKYIPNGTKVKGGQRCQDCKSDSLIYQEGCLICTVCGSSRCG